MGATIVAVTYWKGGVHNPKGLDIPKLIEHVAQHKTVAGFGGGEPISSADFFKLKVDVLIPAALENQITMDNAAGVQAKIIIEGANGPTDPEAHQFRSEEHTSELQSLRHLVCRLLLD